MTSELLERPYPSAIFEGMDIAALLIWVTRQNNSSWGNDLVTRYISSTSCIDFRHASKFL